MSTDPLSMRDSGIMRSFESSTTQANEAIAGAAERAQRNQRAFVNADTVEPQFMPECWMSQTVPY
jgi:hypothetical protein